MKKINSLLLVVMLLLSSFSTAVKAEDTGSSVTDNDLIEKQIAFEEKKNQKLLDLLSNFDAEDRSVEKASLHNANARVLNVNFNDKNSSYGDLSSLSSAKNLIEDIIASSNVNYSNLKIEKSLVNTLNPEIQSNPKVQPYLAKSNRFYTIECSSEEECIELCDLLLENDLCDSAEPMLEVKANSRFRSFLKQPLREVTDDLLFNSDAPAGWGFTYAPRWSYDKINAFTKVREGRGFFRSRRGNTEEHLAGKDTVVAVLDSGVDFNHVDIQDSIWVNPLVVTDLNNDGQINFLDLDTNSNNLIDVGEILPESVGFDFVEFDSDPSDPYGHGTFIAGQISATPNNAIGIVGAAPGAKIMPIRSLDETGAGSELDIGNGIIFAINNGANVINASFGGLGRSSLFEVLFDIADALGIVSIAAAGNDDVDASLFTPANIKSVMAIGATDRENLRTSFSNFGGEVDIAAPGGGQADELLDGTGLFNVVATYPTDGLAVDSSFFIGPNPNADDAFARLAGTSFSAPYVAAIAATLISDFPGFTAQQIKTLLKNSFKKGGDICSEGDLETFACNGLVAFDKHVGEGVIDAEIAFEQARTLDRTIFEFLPNELRLELSSDETTLRGDAQGEIEIQAVVNVASNQAFPRLDNVNLPLSYDLQLRSETEESGNQAWSTFKSGNLDRKSQINNSDLIDLGTLDSTTLLDDNYQFRIVLYTSPLAKFGKKLGNTLRFSDVDTLTVKNNLVVINTCQQLQDIQNDLNGDYELVRDIDCSDTVNWNAGAGFDPIGTGIPFRGTLDGNGHVINDLFINRPFAPSAGLFADVIGANTVTPAIIANLGLENANITATDFTGGVAGFGALAIFRELYVTGNISSFDTFGFDVGGIIGSIFAADLIDSYSQANVAGGAFVGGIAGTTNDVTSIGAFPFIQNVYAAGSLTAFAFTGGLFSVQSPNSVIISSYWDTDVSGEVFSDGGVGLPTAAMQSQASFIDWDFTDVWSIYEGLYYPSL